MNKKFKLIGFRSPIDLSLTEARKYLGSFLSEIDIKEKIQFMGYGNGVNFTIQRVK